MKTESLPADDPWIGALPAELQELLHAELAAGNRVAFTAGSGFDPQTAVLVLLAEPFRFSPPTLPPGVTYQEHEHACWESEYRTDDPLCVLAAVNCV